MRQTIIILAAVVAACVLALGCTDAEWGQVTSLGGEHTVTLYGITGEPIRQWVSSGKVNAESQTDGWYFLDKASGHLVRVSGAVVIETR